jgi:hypothetical protein
LLITGIFAFPISSETLRTFEGVGIAATIIRLSLQPLLKKTLLWLFGIDIINRRNWYIK